MVWVEFVTTLIILLKGPAWGEHRKGKEDRFMVAYFKLPPTVNYSGIHGSRGGLIQK